LFCLLS